jgi:chromosome partitioning protein
LAVHLAAAAEAAGYVSLVSDTDPQATASQWAAWRSERPPEVIDSAPPNLLCKIEQARFQGAEFNVIDTPPHADSAATKAMEAADLVLTPCRPSAFDLPAIQTTAQLVKSFRKPAYVVFTAGSPNAPRMYEEVSELVESFGVKAFPHPMSDRAAYRHASARDLLVRQRTMLTNMIRGTAEFGIVVAAGSQRVSNLREALQSADQDVLLKRSEGNGTVAFHSVRRPGSEDRNTRAAHDGMASRKCRQSAACFDTRHWPNKCYASGRHGARCLAV